MIKRTFDENKVVDVFHPGKAVIGGRYFVEDNLMKLKRNVLGEEDRSDTFIFEELATNEVDENYPFICDRGDGHTSRWAFLYPYEEPSKQRMTNKQLAEWLVKGHGQFTHPTWDGVYIEHNYSKGKDSDEVDEAIVIRPWDSEEWIEPTVDIYERDCRKED